ncbi:MAG: NHL repeat-containing protein [Fusobacteriota bacterium]
MKKIILILLLSLSIISTGAEFFKDKKFFTKIFPSSVTVDKDENVYIADRIRNNVLKYDKNGKYQYSFGMVRDKAKRTKQKGEQKNYPVIIDLYVHNNDLYVLDANYGIMRFNLDGDYKETLISKEGELLGQVKNPQSIYVDDKYICVADTDNNRIQIFTLDGGIVSSFGYKGVKVGAFHRPEGVVRFNENYLVTDTGNNRLSVFDKYGIFEKNLVREEVIFTSPTNIARNDTNVYVVDSGKNRIFIYNENLELYAIFGKTGSKKTEFRGIQDIWATDDKIYVADHMGKAVKVFNKDTTYSQTIGKNRLLNFILTVILGSFFIIIVSVIIFHKTRKQ